MKRILFAFATMALLASGVSAYEIPDNPDRRISFGFNFDHSKSGMDYTFALWSVKNFTETKSNSWLLDVKVPLNSVFTFGLRGGMFYDDTRSFYGEQLESNGYNVGFGIRWYVP